MSSGHVCYASATSPPEVSLTAALHMQSCFKDFSGNAGAQRDPDGHYEHNKYTEIYRRLKLSHNAFKQKPPHKTRDSI